MPKKLLPKYRGKLAEPLKPLPTPLAGMLSGISPDETIKQRRAELIGKLARLLAHYGIARDDERRWFKLALALAFDHVPGFQEALPETRGRRRTWSLEDDRRLFYDISDLLARGKTVRSACEILVRKQPYKDQRRSGEALRSRYVKIKPIFDALNSGAKKKN